jgi:hypothetical protein
MSRRLVVILFSLLFSFSLFAQHTTLVSSVQPSLVIVDAGTSATFETSLRNPGDVRATDVRIVYEISGEAVIERIEHHGGWTCTNAGKTAECTSQFTTIGETRFPVVVRAGASNAGVSILKMTATSAQPTLGQQHIAQGTLQSYHVIPVVTTADAGPGSLRSAIETANGLTVAAKIEFQLPAPVPAEGWFTIIPESPLPPVTVERVFIDGNSQTRFTGDTNTRGPEIAIDGRLAHRGLEVHSPCMARVHGLVLGNFDANQGLWFTKSRECTTLSAFETGIREVVDNYIGTDPTGTVAWPNLRGLRGDFGSGTIRNNVISGNTYSGMWIWVTRERFDSYRIEDNRIGTAADGVTPLPNGAAGILFGDRVSADVRRNIIANNVGMGIALVRGETYVGIRQNSMRDNGGIGIDWGIDGTFSIAPDDPSAPLLLSARYDAASNRTYFTVKSRAQSPPGPDPSIFTMDFYANRGPDGDGETFISEGALSFFSEDGWEAWIPGDHRGKWINATTTRIPQFFSRPPRVSTERAVFGDDSTSEFSNTILVP